MLKSTAIGWSCVMIAKPVASEACTMFPASTSRNPIRPLIGAVIRV